MLYVMSGIPGSGKTTYAHKLRAVYIGTDSIRRELYGKELTMKGYQKVHRIALERADGHLRNGENVVLDSAHLTRHARKKIIKKCGKNYKIKCIYMDVPLNVALSNNKKRSRHVPEIGIKFLNFIKCKPELSEGFDAITVINYPSSVKNDTSSVPLKAATDSGS